MNAVLQLRALLVLVGFVVVGTAHAQLQKSSDYTVLPKAVAPNVPPLVMLAMSNDHNLYYKAYTDFDDVNDNGQLDIEESTYNHAQEYYGYFETHLCYVFDGTIKAFKPVALEDGNTRYCANAQWHGNFLNWATMTRIDVLRKVLYGGKRATENDTDTILERSHLPSDAHSFAKFFNRQYNPALFNGVVDSTLVGENAENAAEGLTLCNTTLHLVGDSSHNTVQPPLMRVVKGNYSLWASGERYQCFFTGNGDFIKEANRRFSIGLDASEVFLK